MQTSVVPLKKSVERSPEIPRTFSRPEKRAASLSLYFTFFKLNLLIIIRPDKASRSCITRWASNSHSGDNTGFFKPRSHSPMPTLTIDIDEYKPKKLNPRNILGKTVSTGTIKFMSEKPRDQVSKPIENQLKSCIWTVSHILRQLKVCSRNLFNYKKREEERGNNEFYIRISRESQTNFERYLDDLSTAIHHIDSLIQSSSFKTNSHNKSITFFKA